MLPEDAGKQCCIFDTISLVKLCQLELSSRRAIQWLLEDFDVSIPKKIFSDGVNKLSTDDDEERTIYFNEIILKINYDITDEYLEFIDNHVSRVPIKERLHIDKGEHIAVSLALGISRLSKQYIVFITDDYKAIEPLSEILTNDQIGIAKTSFDLLLFLGSRHSTELSIDLIEIALKQLNYLLRDNSESARKHQKPDELLGAYLVRLHQLSPTMPGL